MKLSPSQLQKELAAFGLTPKTEPSKVLPSLPSIASNISSDHKLAPAKELVSKEDESIEEGDTLDYSSPTSTLPDPRPAPAVSYLGDLVDNTPPPTGNFVALDFSSCLEFASFFDENINSGKVRLYDWQRETLSQLSEAQPNHLSPHKFALCACNGSGKDAYIIALWAVYFAACKIKSLTIITSSSGVQLSSQTERYIKAFAEKVNTYAISNLGGPIFKINQRFIKCIASGSEIRLFATDEEGKAEGYHPMEPGCEMCIIVNESKSVTPEIHRALRRCTGFNYWIDVSSPGEPRGDFYRHFSKWQHKRRVSYKDCPHHSEQERLEDLEELGESNAYYRSKWLAEFTSIDTSAVIPVEVVDRVKALSKGKMIPWVKASKKRVGIDLAAGGAENACYALEGNRIKERLIFREKDTMLAADRIHLWLLEELHLDHTQEETYSIAIDDNGIGRGTTDKLATYGWVLRRIKNQSSSSNKKMYSNMGAQIWYRAKSILEHNCFILDIEDEKLYEQLSSRYCKPPSVQGLITLESKADAIANGRPSPDRADALILALSDCTKEEFLAAGELNAPASLDTSRPRNTIPNTPEAIAQYWEDKAYSDNQKGPALRFRKPIRGSMTVLINQLSQRRN